MSNYIAKFIDPANVQVVDSRDLRIEELERELEEARRTGQWIHREDMDFLDKNKVEHIHFMCSECGLIHDFLDWHTSQYNYCPNCGARMVSDE